MNKNYTMSKLRKPAKILKNNNIKIKTPESILIVLKIPQIPSNNYTNVMLLHDPTNTLKGM